MDCEIDLDRPPYAVGPADLARILGIGERQAREFVRSGKIYSFRSGRRVLVPKAAIRRLLKSETPISEAR